MEKILQMKISDVPGSHKTPHDGYDFYKHNLVPREIASQCTVAVYEIMPGKSAVPYHYHLKNEETFYIISGSGELKTPDGCKTVSAGDFLFFPANENGAHKLTRMSHILKVSESYCSSISPASSIRKTTGRIPSVQQTMVCPSCLFQGLKLDPADIALTLR